MEMAPNPRGVLILDDEPSKLKQVVCSALNMQAVYAHGSATAAIRALMAHASTIDMVICGLKPHELDGVEFLRLLNRLRYRGALLLVGDDREKALKAAQRAAQAHGFDVMGTLVKPFTPAQFSARMVARPVAPAARTSTPYPCSLAQLRAAIGENQFVNYYQPKVELKTGSLVGVETLVRWNHPTFGQVLPGDFMPLAEEAGLIDGITRGVLDRALADLRRWRSAGHRFDVAINISMSTLAYLDLPELVERAAIRMGVPVSSLIFEITEGMFMDQPQLQLDTLARLRIKGIRLSVDDFGVGNACMAMIRDLPFDELKIDQSFVHGASEDPALRAVLAASLQLARDLGMKAVGEGVANRADWELLAQSGCDMAQGYFVGRPMPGNSLESWLPVWAARLRHTKSDLPAATRTGGTTPL